MDTQQAMKTDEKYTVLPGLFQAAAAAMKRVSCDIAIRRPSRLNAWQDVSEIDPELSHLIFDKQHQPCLEN